MKGYPPVARDGLWYSRLRKRQPVKAKPVHAAISYGPKRCEDFAAVVRGDLQCVLCRTPRARKQCAYEPTPRLREACSGWYVFAPGSALYIHSFFRPSWGVLKMAYKCVIVNRSRVEPLSLKPSHSSYPWHVVVGSGRTSLLKMVMSFIYVLVETTFKTHQYAAYSEWHIIQAIKEYHDKWPVGINVVDRHRSRFISRYIFDNAQVIRSPTQVASRLRRLRVKGIDINHPTSAKNIIFERHTITRTGATVIGYVHTEGEIFEAAGRAGGEQSAPVSL
ncbi:hypothetical protein B0H16DRAFT_1465184 [Mycena metata]|uniref:Uncharacterized protein n=1 Tax=Mycena metata TaxID=1033252 RepID=A0AAD7IBP6_9AGAR|nr:hypothetical protein B0H16DRAFT_1465184 [Mycena metata]